MSGAPEQSVQQISSNRKELIDWGQGKSKNATTYPFFASPDGTADKPWIWSLLRRSNAYNAKSEGRYSWQLAMNPRAKVDVAFSKAFLMPVSTAEEYLTNRATPGSRGQSGLFEKYVMPAGGHRSKTKQIDEET